MSSQPGELPEEYFSECDEHLAAARQAVLALERSVGRGQVDEEQIKELFRSFHSIKGLSAMVGVSEAEDLAHAMESFLGALRRGAALTAGGLAALAEGVKTLDAAVESRRVARAMHDAAPALESLAAATAAAFRQSGAPETMPPVDTSLVRMTTAEKVRLENALSGGKKARWFTFAPEPGLLERGINVGMVRKRLEEIGEIVHASPQVNSAGAVCFVFVVATQAERESLDALRDCGVTLVEGDSLSTVDLGSTDDELAAAAAPRPRTNLVRVELAKLDDLMRMVGELLVTRGRFEQTLRRAGGSALADQRALHETNDTFERQLRELREAVTRVRLVPVREVFERMRFVVSDLTRGSEKTVELDLVGEDTEVDKLVVERLAEPLLHLVRNAVSHGLESVTERTAAGKAAAGRLVLRASTAGETVVIEIEDDGRGIDAPFVRSRAIDAGLIEPDAEVDPDVLLGILTTAGFSTRDGADRASGRGVGMAAVRDAVNELSGSLEMSTSPSAGTCFTIRMPLSMAIVDALIVTVGDQRFAAPRISVREVLRVERRNITSLAADEILQHRGQAVHLLRLARAFNIIEAQREAVYVLMVGGSEDAVGLVVDGIEGLREIVVRPLLDPLVRQRGIGGATELGDRRAVLILDTKSLVDRRAALLSSKEMP